MQVQRQRQQRFGARSGRWPGVLLCAFLQAGCGTTLPESAGSREIAALDAPPLAFPFERGEEMTLDATLAGLPAGAIRLRVAQDAPRDRVAFEMAAASSRIVSLVVATRQQVRVECDARTLRPRIYRLAAEVSDKSQRMTMVFDDASRSTLIHRTLGERTSVHVVRGTEAFDPLSLVYVVRSLRLEPGTQRTYPVLLGVNLYRADVLVLGKEPVAGPDGNDVDAFHLGVIVTTVPREPGVAPVRKTVFDAWLEADSPRRVLRIEQETRFGTLTLELTER